MTTARKVRLVVTLVVVLLVAGVGTLFTIQNSSRVTDLSLDVWVFATHLQQPIAVPYLLWAAFGIGLSIGLLWALVSRIRLSSKLNDLEVRAARADLGRTDDDDWT